MFRRTVNAPPKGGEGIHDTSIYAVEYRHTSKVIQDEGMCLFSNHVSTHTPRRFDGGEAAANPSICVDFDVSCNRIHAIIFV